MIEETGLVVSVRGATAEVEAQRRGACGGCSVNGACGTSLLERYLGRKRSLLMVQNAVGAVPGDRVVVGMPEGALLTASFAAYLVPLLAMIGGAIAGVQLAGVLAPSYEQPMSILTGLGGLVAALAWLRRFSLVRSSDERYRPRILRRIGQRDQGHAVAFHTSHLPGQR